MEHTVRKKSEGETCFCSLRWRMHVRWVSLKTSLVMKYDFVRNLLYWYRRITRHGCKAWQANNGIRVCMECNLSSKDIR